MALLRQELASVHAAIFALREESRLAHQALQTALARLAERLNIVEPVVTRLDGLRQKGWAALSTVLVITYIFVGSASSGFRWVAFKLGIDLP